ncbi:MAG: M20 metallopeptidase family protein [Anaerovoracaceae bacterium]|jgi:amidohydrolase
MQNELIEGLSKLVDRITPWAVNLRHDLHRWPEIGNEEYKTTERIKAELNNLGIPTKQLLSTGIIGILKGTKEAKEGQSDCTQSEKKVIALRADIDALPIREQVRLPFSSERHGFMHACGHDVHTAVLLGVAKVLCEYKSKFNGTIKFIFQPAEETTGGAERMIDAGSLKDPNVDAVYGFHVKPEYTAGKIGIKYGKVHASSDIFRIKINGVASHGACPDCGIDALVVACQIVNAIQTLISRSVSPLDSAVISIGSFHSGNSVNIIADKAVLEGTIRTFDPVTREHLRGRLKDMVELTAKAAGAIAEVEFLRGYDALINHNKEVDQVKNTAFALLGGENVIEMEQPSMGVEDFAYYLQKIPGAFFFLGSGYPYRDNPPIHSDCFHVNEACIHTGILLLAGLSLREV